MEFIIETLKNKLKVLENDLTLCENEKVRLEQYMSENESNSSLVSNRIKEINDFILANEGVKPSGDATADTRTDSSVDATTTASTTTADGTTTTVFNGDGTTTTTTTGTEPSPN